MKIKITAIILIPALFMLKSVIAQEFIRVDEDILVTGVGISSGACWGDIDNDGFLDVFIPSAKWNHNFLYLNDRSGGFTEVINSPVVIDSADSKGGTFGDFDNDGDLDLFVANEEATNFLYTNDGEGTFTQVSTGIVVSDGENSSSHTSSWIDYNNDGYLDIFVANHRYDKSDEGQMNFLYQNNEGDGTFTKITQGSIVTDIEFTLGANWADYDNDGDSDLFISNSDPTSGNSDANSLYQNNSDGSFKKIIDEPFVTDGGESRCASWGDYNNDGYLDLFVVNRTVGNDQMGLNILYRNNGDGSFTKIVEGPVVTDQGSSYSCCWGDYDNDGDLDLFVANRHDNNFLYSNNGDGTFEKVTTGSIVTDSDDSRGSTWIDYDNDGDLDLFVANYNFVEDEDPNNDGEENALYKNEGNNNSWINIKCEGTISNRSAIGAKVRVKALINGKQTWQVREISGQTSGGFCAQNSLNTEFGFGDAQIIDSISINWPSGIQWDTVNVIPNQFLIITEKSAPQSLAAPLINYPQEISLMQNYPNPFNPETVIEYSLSTPENVNLTIFNLSGVLIKTLVNSEKSAGLHKVIWDCTNETGARVGSGIYFYAMHAGDFSSIKKMIHVK
jgi:hypothetical protein